MDPQVKKRLTKTITIHPSTGTTDGDKTFGPSFTLLGYIQAKPQNVIARTGEQVLSTTAIFLDGSDFDKITPDDEVEIFLGRFPIKSIAYYDSLVPNIWELLEVFI